MICPIMSKGVIHNCAGDECQFWSETKQDCLVAMALATYIDKENTVSEEVKSFKHQMDLSPYGFMTFQEKNRNE